jgi:hypothetical protein
LGAQDFVVGAVCPVMRDTPLLDIDLTASLWVFGVFVASMLALRFAEHLAHTRARNRTRLAIESTRESVPKKSQINAE